MNSDLDDATRLQAFENRIARGEKIEPGDWMPVDYRHQLIRMISQHAHSEVVGMLPEGAWITCAPNLRRKMVLMAKVQDEAGHGQYLYHAAETLGTTRDEMLQALLNGRAKYSSIFNYPTLTWSDVAWIGWLVDGAAIKNQTMLAQCSYGPYSRAMVRICAEETFHYKQGKEMIVKYMTQGTAKQKAMVQDGLNRWWWPTLMMFGPHDTDSPNSPVLMRWGIKTKSNDTLRQEFLNEEVPQVLALGLSIPDPDLKFNEETNDWEPGPINWEEFWQVVRGHGPMNAERLAARQQAHDDGTWVREAAAAYAEKQWPRYEVFKQDSPHKSHEAVGSVHAPDAETALLNARDVFARRPNVVSMWVAPETAVFSMTAAEIAANPNWYQEQQPTSNQPTTYHIFTKTSQRRSMTFVQHVGTVTATTPIAALHQAITSGEFSSNNVWVWWIVPENMITRSEPDDVNSLFAPALDKTYRQQTYYGFVDPIRKRGS